MARALTAATGWLTRPVPRGRIAAFRTLIYLFVAADLLLFTPWVRDPARLSGELYQPLFVGRLLPLPTPTPLLLSVIFWALLGLSLVAATGRAPRALGWPVFVLYFEWMIIAMSYGKVDHDRFAFLVALAVLPTAGRARHGDPVRTEAGGWALRVTQIAVVCTYFLAAWAKLRFGGIEWLTGSVLARAIIRRGTELADLIAQVPYLLIAAQLGIVAFELLSPIVFVLTGRWRRAVIGFFYSFHLVTFATITISFAPHLVAMTAFLRLERIRPIHWLRRRIRPTGRHQPVPAQAVAERKPPPSHAAEPSHQPVEPSEPVGAETQPAAGGLGTAQAAVPPGIR
ncbi:MFS transporter permease [Solwaraspora sp. WMMD1047]|uniref:MFS transporter permease n=1 Tax=Solwaraspora sp. WMMD1047 TaxID=3016102 RepID=UPI0024175AA9|nr:MFS transporter permease [Solwaraspora sp. WMMD1047]MDG4833510.1 MFS transporter permease [Solwaraspora sp. WMMD1047]